MYPLPTNFFQALSPKGQIVLIENKVYDAVSKVTSPLNPAPTGNGTVWAYAVNDAGVVAPTQFNCATNGQLNLALRELNGVKPKFDVHMTGVGLVYGNLHDNTNAVIQAFVWFNGQAQNLNAYVTSKGAKLPTGATLTRVRSINDQGSVVATMLGADKKTVSIVRLTARGVSAPSWRPALAPHV